MNAAIKLYNLLLAFFKPLREFVPIEYQSDLISSTITNNANRTGFIIKLFLPLSILMGIPDIINLILGMGNKYYNIAGLSINLALFLINLVFYYIFKNSKKNFNLVKINTMLKVYVFTMTGSFFLYSLYINSMLGDYTAFYISLVLSMVIFVMPDFSQIYNALISAIILTFMIYNKGDDYIHINNNIQVLFICTIVSMIFWRIERKHVSNEFINKKMYEQAKESADELNISLLEKNKEIESQNEILKNLIATKDKFFSIIAHDIKNPFSAIVNLSAIISDMERFELTKEEVKEYANNIHSATKNLNSLLENLLIWSRSQRGMLCFEPEKTNISYLFEYVSSLLECAAGQKCIRINNYISKDINIQIDTNMMSTVFRNILANAIKFTNKGGEIKIYSEHIIAPFEGYRITIEDTGVGISPENMKKLFLIEESITTLGTNDEVGSGLGLLLCYEFVNRHSGKIYAESEVSVGTKIIIELPI